MKLQDAKTSELLPLSMEYASFLCDAFDTFLHYMNGRADALPAPMTYEACLALNDEEMQAYFEQFGLAKYYPDVSHERRAWLLFQQQSLWRYLGTSKAIETLCQYLFDEVDVSLEVSDNLAFSQDGRLVRPELLHLFDAVLDVSETVLPANFYDRLYANIRRFVRDQEQLRSFTISFEALEQEVGVAVTDGGNYESFYNINIESE